MGFLKFTPIVTIIGFIAFATSPRVFAAQEATVSSSNASIYQLLDGKAVPQVAIAQGTVIRISDQPQGVWFRCTIPGTQPPQLGWILRRDLSVGGVLPNVDPPGDTLHTPTLTSRPQPSIELLYALAFSTPSNLQAAASLVPALSVGSLISAQILFPVSQRFKLGFRVEAVFLGGQLATASGTSHSYSGFALPIVGASELNLLSIPGFDLGLLAGIGVSPLTSGSVTSSAGTFDASLVSLVVPLGIQTEIGLGRKFLLRVEAGYQLFVGLTSAGLASGHASGSDFSTPFAGAGLGCRL